MSKVSFDVKQNGNNVFVTLTGMIDEDMDFSQIKTGDATSIEIDLGGVKSINSCGIREWIKWISEFRNAQIHLKNCPKIIVDQINMVQGFLPATAKVMSFYVPYYSEDSGSEKDILFEYGKHFTEDFVNMPESVLDDEGNPMEIDVVESKYFKFLNR
jgi:anti-anti-sigma regulatory factor